MYVAMPYFVFMEATVPPLIHGGTILIFGAHVSQFLFCCLVGGREDEPCGATLMLKPMMCIISLCSAMCHMDHIGVILSRMTPVNRCYFLNVLNRGCVRMVSYVRSSIVHGI